jgi:ribosome biogenesis GTPase / thiamine phosphate phosphatase
MEAITGTVAKSTGSWYKILTDHGDELDARLKGRFRLKGKSLTNPVAVGDKVVVLPESEGRYVINEILKRENYLLRKSTKLSSKYQIVASNIDLAVIMATMVKPRTSPGFIDRFLTTCESFGIPAAIIFNKTDLMKPSEVAEMKQFIGLYTDMGYESFATTFLSGQVQDEIGRLFTAGTTLLFGHSGVGKSTLINKLIPGSEQQVAEISEYHGKGRHTTTFARMFVTPGGHRIIDTPGVKEFGMEPLEPWKVGHYFRDFTKYLGHCKFNNCLHTDEPTCAVIEAVIKGKLSERRYQSYLSMLSEIDED